MKNFVSNLLLAGLVLLATVLPGRAQADFTPEWSKGVVWYQIFPERFSNGDPRNDPKATDQNGAYPFDDSSAFQIHPWASDWYRLQPYEQKNGRDIYYNLQRRRYGGDVQGILNKLDYLQALGVNALYLTPVFWSPSSHKYDALCYHHVDPTFGPDPEGDKKLIATENPLKAETWVWTKADLLVLRLIDEVHKRKMHLIFDGVFNHLGAQSFAFQDVVKNQQASPYADWFMVKSWRNAATGTAFAYNGWFGVQTLPELKEDETGLVAGPKQYIFNATQRWMNPLNKGAAHGIDGWRLDVAYDVGHPFWKSWRQWVRRLNPQAYLTAELVFPVEKTRPYLRGDEFDATMNYNFAFAVHDFFVQDATAIPVTVFDARLKELREAFGPGVALNMQNLVGSHDATRIGSAVANPDGKQMGDWGPYFNWSQKSNNQGYNARKPTPAQLQKQKLIAAFQLLYLGAPMIFYGDEAGMWGPNDPDCRKPMVWADQQYAPETANPDQSSHAPDAVAFNKDLFAWYQKFIALRRRSPAIQRGTFTTVATDDARQLYAFRRTLGNDDVLVVFNRGPQPVAVDPALLAGHRYRDAFTRAAATRATVRAMDVVVLRAN
ncbi:alpha-glucosidase C-terminal domain-containing protein [Hymenobacter sp. BT683]|uniref:Alpha-glucosidase C-terminal domain-containing protein n=1 Tax=Hymenobacter jeongseonensis TaxID=2791027 RepID=A0ABS0IN87_9BACT|nr:glycoside hydrolase family 13 protein [Hymenobacter jeongseonensis]MBF9239652.1 alpha-glucosidase C-terminal domain-containing protein [Hymenobacter jeongseonensis]